ncbi:hypothetical protein [Schaalia sp. lx-100]|nr:hypothetical protein [Schaalia sp. lx-100]MCD4558076.1 hypothetical protein [Schaalia sp. lx-100]
MIHISFGNGDEHQHHLGSLHDQVQARVNAKLGY